MRALAQQRALLLQPRLEPGRNLGADDPHRRGQDERVQVFGQHLGAADDECRDAERDEGERAPAPAGEADIGEGDRDGPGIEATVPASGSRHGRRLLDEKLLSSSGNSGDHDVVVERFTVLSWNDFQRQNTEPCWIATREADETRSYTVDRASSRSDHVYVPK